jgi:probable rRNA maturation factor
VALVSDARMRALNYRYRGKDYATDVLSFPAGGPRRSTGGGPKRSALRAGAVARRTSIRKPPPIRHLGDFVIASGVARRQARQAGHAEMAELRLLALHGLLHLLGYDHERDSGQMARLERKLRRLGGLPEGLIERA